MKNKKALLFFFFLFGGIALFINSLIHSGFGEIWNSLRHFSALNFMLFIGVSFFNFYLYSLRWSLILHALSPEKKVSQMASFLHRMAGFSLSYVTPVAQLGGEPIRVLLMEEEGISRKVAVNSVVIDKALELAALIVFIVLGMVAALADGTVPLGAKGFLWAFIVLMLLLIFWFYYTSIKNIGFISSIFKFLRLNKVRRLEKLDLKIHTFEQEMNTFYREHPKTLYQLVVISIATTAFILLEHYMVGKFLGVDLTFFQIFLSSTIPYLAYLLPVPGGLGVLESGHAAIFALLGVSVNVFVFVLIIRLRDLFFVAIGLIHASKRGLTMLKKEFKNDFVE